MAILVTRSAGHLGEALMRTLLEAGRQSIGIDITGRRAIHLAQALWLALDGTHLKPEA